MGRRSRRSRLDDGRPAKRKRHDEESGYTDSATVARASAGTRAPMTSLLRDAPAYRSATSDARVSANQWVVPSLVLVLTAVTGWREGGFWSSEAMAVVVIAGVLLATGVVLAPPDRRTLVALGGLGLLALWWWLRSVTAGTGADFLPLGASILAFATAFCGTRPLAGHGRQWGGLALACLGAACALSGFAGLVWRWSPLAMPAQGLWRLSSTLTYADATGLVLGACLLLALGCDRCPVLVRVVVCLNAAGLLATQSREAFVAVACALFLVPARRWRIFAMPLAAGTALGVAAIASSAQGNRVPWLGLALVASVALAVWDAPPLRSPRSWPRGWAFVGASLCVTVGLGLVLHREVGLRVFSPSNSDRFVEWSTALRQWASDPLFGVGPDRLLVFHAADGTSARFVHNEYLQVAADGGVLGVGLLGLVALSLTKVLHRVDALSSCAVAALVCVAVGGAFDFDWHLPVVGLVAGWCAGLAGGTKS
jgi:O-Antigen ligase